MRRWMETVLLSVAWVRSLFWQTGLQKDRDLSLFVDDFLVFLSLPGTVSSFYCVGIYYIINVLHTCLAVMRPRYWLESFLRHSQKVVATRDNEEIATSAFEGTQGDKDGEDENAKTEDEFPRLWIPKCIKTFLLQHLEDTVLHDKSFNCMIFWYNPDAKRTALHCRPVPEFVPIYNQREGVDLYWTWPPARNCWMSQTEIWTDF